jgi:hypothetical protein
MASQGLADVDVAAWRLVEQAKMPTIMPDVRFDGTSPPDLEQRVELRELVGLPPVITPNPDGLKELDGLVEGTGKKFNGVELLEDLRLHEG